MLTLFALPKPFRGHIDIIQRNAICSWIALHPQCQVILFGDEEGTAEVAQEFGVCHITEVAKNQYGTPLLNDIFKKAAENAEHETLCYVNCDIILMSDFVRAMNEVVPNRKRFLMIGQCWNLDVTETVDFDQPDWEDQLCRCVQQSGKPRGPAGIDFFVFPRGFYQTMPPFASGRAWFDHWLIWKARNLKSIVVDVTAVTIPIHQNHDYSHVAGGQSWSYGGEEAQHNLELAGGKTHLYQMYETTHKLTNQGLRTNWKGLLKFRVIMEQWGWPILDRTRPLRRALGLHKG